MRFDLFAVGLAAIVTLFGQSALADTYQDGPFSLEIDAEADCVWDTLVEAVFRHPAPSLIQGDLDEAQAALRRMAEQHHAKCERVGTINLSIQGNGGRAEGSLIERKDYWQLRQMSSRYMNDGHVQTQAELLKEFRAAAPGAIEFGVVRSLVFDPNSSLADQCKVVSAWLDAIEAQAGSETLARPVRDYQALMKATAPAFHPPTFPEFFGKEFLEFRPDELQNMGNRFSGQCRDPRFNLVAAPFTVPHMPRTSGPWYEAIFGPDYKAIFEEAAAVRARKLQERLADSRREQETAQAEAVAARHPLTDYGYYNSVHLADGPGYTLYLARTIKSDRYPAYVMVHEAEGDTPFLPTFEQETGGSIGVFVSPEFYEGLERALNAGPHPAGGTELSHYIAGYHHPKDDRLGVLGPNAFETPILKSNFSVVWEGQWKVAPYGREIGFNDRGALRGSGGVPLVLSLNDAVRHLGPSADPSPEAAMAAAEEAAETLAAAPLLEEGPKASYLAEQVKLRQAALARGLVYKNDAYWATFQSIEVRRIFEGYHQYYGVGGLTLPAILMRYLTLNSETCAAAIENPQQFKLEEITRYFDELNQLTGTSTDTLYDITVPGRFAPILRRNYDEGDAASNAQQGLAAAFSYMQSGSFAAQVKQLRENIASVQAAQADVERLLRGQSCASPIRRQFEEMLYHYVVPQNPGEHTTLRMADANSVSDAVYQPGHAPTLKAACVLNNLGDTLDPLDRRKIEWCGCISDVISNMAPDRVDRYTKRYRQLGRDMSVAETAWQRGQEHPDIRLVASQRSCAR